MTSINVIQADNVRKSSSTYSITHSKLTNTEKENAKAIYKTFKELGFSKVSAEIAVKNAYQESNLEAKSCQKTLDTVGFYNWNGACKKELLQDDPDLSTKGQLKFIKKYVKQLNRNQTKRKQFEELKHTKDSKKADELFKKYFLNAPVYDNHSTYEHHI